MVPKLTASGKNLLLRALAGETITFTKIQLGNGTAQDPAEATGLANPIITVELSKIVVGTEYVTLTAQFTNSSITSGFHITEAGFYAKDPNDDTKEILYAIGNEDESSADYVPNNADRILEMQFDALIFIGDAENVSAAISSSLVYASKEDFDKHTVDRTNPHSVTKQQVGLGNVPNLAPSDQVPTFTEATSLANIVSGEKVSTLFGKIKLAISKLIEHLNNRNNPHNITASQVGAAAKSHTHNAQDINSGTLSTLRGGTGMQIQENFESFIQDTVYMVGAYRGDSTQDRLIDVGFTPKAVLLLTCTGSGCWFATPFWNSITADAQEEGEAYLGHWDNSKCILGIAENGFRVNCNPGNGIFSNIQGSFYQFIAFK